MTAITWEPAAVIPRGIVATVVDPPAGSITLHWGDGASRPFAGPALHTYPAPNTYTLTAWLDGAIIATAPVTIRDGLVPDVAHSHNEEWSQEQRWRIDVTGPDLPGGVVTPLRVDWPPDAWLPPECLIEIAYPKQGYRFGWPLKPGTREIMVSDLATRRARRDVVEIPETIYDPDITMTHVPAEEDPSGYMVEFTVTNVQTAKGAIGICTYGYGCGEDDYREVVIEKPEIGSTVRYTYDPEWLDRDTAMAHIKYLQGDIGRGQRPYLDMPRPARTRLRHPAR